MKEVNIRTRTREVIELVEKAKSLHEVEDLKKLRGGEKYYRLRVGDYRIGLILDQGTFIFVRLLHRKDIYRYFP